MSSEMKALEAARGARAWGAGSESGAEGEHEKRASGAQRSEQASLRAAFGIMSPRRAVKIKMLAIALLATPLMAAHPAHAQTKPAFMPDGTITIVGGYPAGSVSCTGNAATGATCWNFNETCPNTDPISGQIAITYPSGGASASLGTIGFFSGLPVSSYFGSGTGATSASQFANSVVSGGYTAWQALWNSSGSDPNNASLTGTYPESIRAAWCRGDTLMRWIYVNVHHSNLSKGFSMMGHSEGGTQVGGALTYYGAWQYIDFFLASTTPITGDFVQGCTCTGTCSNTVCPGDNDGYKMAAGNAAYPYSWTGSQSCQLNSGAGPFAQNDETLWSQSSLDNPDGATFNYPNTVIHAYEAWQSDEEPGQAMFWLNKLTIMGGGAPVVNCYGSSVSDGEAWWTTNGTTQTAAYTAGVNDLEANTVPNH
jgi:hypothetical protein